MAAGECGTGDMRLSDSSKDLTQNTSTGTLQICINNAWGAVCHDNFFGVADAQVACQQAGGYERYVVGEVGAAVINGLVFLSELDCMGDEETLLSCTSYSSLGSECVTNEAPVITCRG